MVILQVDSVIMVRSRVGGCTGLDHSATVDPFKQLFQWLFARSSVFTKCVWGLRVILLKNKHFRHQCMCLDAEIMVRSEVGDYTGI